MSNIQLVSGNANTLNTRVPFLITGFGFLRSISGEPWFIFRDLQDAIPEGPFKGIISPSKGAYSGVLGKLEERELMQSNGRVLNAKTQQSKDTSPRIVSITALGQEALLNTAVHMVTKQGATLPDILFIPDVVTAVLEGSDFKERLVAAVAGPRPGFQAQQ